MLIYQHCRFYKYLNILIIEWKQFNEEVNERIPDEDLERSKHVGLFHKSVLSDFRIT